jgi:predicted PurR-regulated permease PerM
MKLFATTRTTREWFNENEKAEPPTAIAPQTLIAWSVFGLFLMALLTAMYFVQAVLMPVVAAAVVAVIFSPVMRWLERRRLPSSVSALVIIVGFILAIAAAATAVVPTVRELSSQLPQMAARMDFKLADIRASLKSFKEAREKLDRATNVGEVRNPDVSSEARPAAGGGVGEVLFQIGLFAVLTFFFLVSRRVYRRRVILAQSTQAARLKVARILRDMGRRVSTYLFTVSMINVGLGIAIGAALALLGMQAAIALGLAAVILNFVPFIGPILVIVATAALSLATFDDWSAILAAPGIVLTLHLIESQIISPWLVGRRLEMSPLAVFGGIALLGWMWGAVGAMIAVPLLILLYTFGQHIPVLSPLATLIGPTEGDEIEEVDDPQPDSSDPAPVQAVPLLHAKANAADTPH